MSQLDTVAVKIIKEQELVIGPLAWSEAKKVSGLSVNGENVTIQGEPKAVIDKLVAQYERLFGRASREVCREAAASLIAKLPQAEIPSSLQTV